MPGGADADLLSTVIHKDLSSYKVQAVDNGPGARSAVVLAV